MTCGEAGGGTWPDRCSAWARAIHLDPVGTAGAYRGFLLVEWPLPWPRDLSLVPELEAVAELAASLQVRVQGLVPSRQCPEHRLALYVQARSGPGRAASGFALRRDEMVPLGEVPGLAAELLGGLDDGSSERDRRREATEQAEVLVCSHGSRDRCCGSAGTRLAAALQRSGGLGGGVRLWRTSHLGGHRFAPTALLLPAGTMWAYLDEAVLTGIMERSLDAATVADCYRGHAGIGSPRVQALEREVLRRVGWSLLDSPRWGEDLDSENSALFVERVDGSLQRWTGRTVTGRELPLHPCGEWDGCSGKTVMEVVVSEVAATEGGASEVAATEGGASEVVATKRKVDS